MIVVDTSALVAIAFLEPDAERFATAINDADDVLIGAPTLFELRMVLTGRFGADGGMQVAEAVVPLRAIIVPFDALHAAVATDAFVRFGKKRHPAALNYGDCMAYAVAWIARCPLLYKGNNFASTDIRSAL